MNREQGAKRKRVKRRKLEGKNKERRKGRAKGGECNN